MRRISHKTEAAAASMTAPQPEKKPLMRREPHKTKSPAHLKTSEKGHLMRRVSRKTQAPADATTSPQSVQKPLMRRQPRKTMVTDRNGATFNARLPLLFLFSVVAAIGLSNQAKGALLQIL